jgi:hypothetical protein
MADEVLMFIIKSHVTSMLGGKDNQANEGLLMHIRGVLIQIRVDP